MEQLFNQIQNYNPGKEYHDGEKFEILLTPRQEEYLQEMEVGNAYKIKVLSYMIKPATIRFDFMKNWNNNIPMPSNKMNCEVLKETRGMFYCYCWDKDNSWQGWILKSSIKNYKEIKK